MNELRATMAAHFRRPVTLTSIGWALERHHVYAISDAPAVVKVYGVRPAKKVAARWALEALAGTGLPAPRMLAEGTLPGGAPWILMSRLPGRPLSLLPGALGTHEAHALGALLASLHQQQVVPALGDEARQALFARYQGKAGRWPVEEGDHPALSQAFVWMAEGAPAVRDGPVPGALVHGDYSTRNVLFDQENGALGIIDFENAHLGDPASDWARLYVNDLIERPTLLGAAVAGYQSIAAPDERFWQRVRFYLGVLVIEIAGWAYTNAPSYFAQTMERVQATRARLPAQ